VVSYWNGKRKGKGIIGRGEEQGKGPEWKKGLPILEEKMKADHLLNGFIEDRRGVGGRRLAENGRKKKNFRPNGRAAPKVQGEGS